MDKNGKEGFSDKEFEQYLNENSPLSALSSILAVREKVRSIIDMFRAESETCSSIDDEDLRKFLRDHLKELVNNFRASMTQFDFKILEELGMNEDDDNDPDDPDDTEGGV